MSNPMQAESANNALIPYEIPKSQLSELSKSLHQEADVAYVLLERVQNRALLENAQGRECCKYCGDFYQCRDHVRPVRMMMVKRGYNPKDVVPCCNMCNTLAGDYPAQGVWDKSLYLVERYKTKFRKILSQPHWSKVQIDELGKNLKGFVLARVFLKELIRRKLENLDLVSQGYKAVPIQSITWRNFG